MRLTLNVPPAWAAVDRGGLSMATIPGAPGEPELSLRWSGLEILPDDQKAWVQRNLTSGAAAICLAQAKNMPNAVDFASAATENKRLFVGGIPKRPTGADCKSAGLRLRWFESTSLHQFQTCCSAMRE